MILILPAAYLALLGAIAATRTEWGWRRSALRTAVLWGSYAVGLTEVLSAVGRLTRIGVLVGWSLLSVGCLMVLAYCVARRRSVGIHWPQWRLVGPEWILVLAVGFPMIVTAIVAWYAPPQTWDSLNYHMPRVAHWAQQGSVKHFATGIEVQNSRPPGAEFLVLQTYLLAGGDRFANFAQWSAMLVSLMGVSLLAGQLGAERRGQWMAAAFVATLPMGIIQASSTTTDYLVSLWCLAATSETLSLRERGPRLDILGYLGLAAGLGLATKPTAVAYLAPIAAYAAYNLLRQSRLLSVMGWAVIPAVLIALLNVGHLSRNLSTYGSLFDPGQVKVHSNQLRDPRGVISNVLRHAGLEAGTPSPHLNKALALGVRWIHRLMGLDVNDPRTTAHGMFKISIPTTNEDRAGNPFHFYLLAGLIVYLLVKRKPPAGPPWLLLAFLGSSILVLSYLFKWQIFASRYHLPFFVLAGGLAGFLLERLAGGRWAPAVGAALLISAWPWLFQIRSRPLIPRGGESYVGSILREPREKLYLANGLHLLEPYLRFTSIIEEGRCQRVGIVLSGNAAEYPLWAFLDAPASGTQIGWIVAGTPSEKYASPEFEPCAVICEGCSTEVTHYRDLPLVEERGNLRLFLDTSDE